MSATILVGDVREMLATLPDASVQCVITSPPYWKLRSYMPTDHPDKSREIGSEATLAEYIAVIVDVFRHVRRVLRPDGCVFLNMGDAYAANRSYQVTDNKHIAVGNEMPMSVPDGLKPKDLMMIPHRVAIALQEDGWWVRQDNVWSKPNPMPESVTDRTTRAHEYVFHLTKSATYFYDAEAIREPAKASSIARLSQDVAAQEGSHRANGGAKTNGTMKAVGRLDEQQSRGANKRSVWHVATQGFSGAHYATFPEALITPCVLAGTSERGQCPACGAPWRRCVSTTYENPGNRTTNGDRSTANRDITSGFETRLERRSETTGWSPGCNCDAGPPVPQTILDPFIGSGTTAVVALRHGRHCIGIDIDERNATMARDRITGAAPLFNTVSVA